MYLLDADWHPQADTLERTLEVLEASDQTAFVQTKRLTKPSQISLFQKFIALIEEGCYYVDFEGRQALNHPNLFSGCCTLFRLDAISAVGGFTPGHLTEDLDLTNRLWLAGWKGAYNGSVVNYGEVPFTYNDYRRQQERWASGSTRSLREFFWKILVSRRLNWIEKASAIRQNAYFLTTVMTGFAVITGFVSMGWLVSNQGSYNTEYFLYKMQEIKVPFLSLLLVCVISNIVEPLAMVIKSRRPKDFFLIPMMVWYAWGVLPTYILGNVKGFFRIHLDWFRTPKIARSGKRRKNSTPIGVRLLNGAILTAFLFFYFVEGSKFMWLDVFALILIPSFILATFE